MLKIDERIVEFESERYEIKNTLGVDSDIIRNIRAVSGKPIAVIRNLNNGEFAVIGSVILQSKNRIVVHYNGVCYFVLGSLDLPIIHEDKKESTYEKFRDFVDNLDRELTIDEYIIGFINML